MKLRSEVYRGMSNFLTACYVITLFHPVSFSKACTIYFLSVSKTSLVSPSIPYRLIYCTILISAKLFNFYFKYLLQCIYLCNQILKYIVSNLLNAKNVVNSFWKGHVEGERSHFLSLFILVFWQTLGFRVFLTLVSGLSRTHGLARGARPLGARRNPPAALQHAPKMAPVVPGLGLVLDPDQNPG